MRFDVVLTALLACPEFQYVFAVSCISAVYSAVCIFLKIRKARKQAAGRLQRGKVTSFERLTRPYVSPSKRNFHAAKWTYALDQFICCSVLFWIRSWLCCASPLASLDLQDATELDPNPVHQVYAQEAHINGRRR